MNDLNILGQIYFMIGKGHEIGQCHRLLRQREAILQKLKTEQPLGTSPVAAT
jgi:hypothetical protein